MNCGTAALVDVTIEARAIADELVLRHPHFAPKTIERLALRTFAQFNDAAIRTYLPILVRREVEAQLCYADPDELPSLVTQPPSLGRQASRSRSETPRSPSSSRVASPAGPRARASMRDAAVDLSRKVLSGSQERWRHTVGVGARAEVLADALVPDAALRGRLVAAAWLHDIGYSPALRDTGFHPLDGARHLQRLCWPPEVVDLVAHHSGARFVARARGLAEELEHFRFADDLLTDLLTYADQTVGPDGVPTTVQERIADMLDRHGPDSPNARAHPEREPYLLEVATRVRSRLADAGRPDLSRERSDRRVQPARSRQG